MGSLSLLYYFLNFLCMGGFSCYCMFIGAGLATILFVIYMNSSFNFFWNLISSFAPNIRPDPARVNNTRIPGRQCTQPRRKTFFSPMDLTFTIRHNLCDVDCNFHPLTTTSLIIQTRFLFAAMSHPYLDTGLKIPYD